jgi:tape measure domain-containing protein
MTSRTITYEYTAKQSLTEAFQQTTKDVNAAGQAMGSLSQKISTTVSEQDKLRVSVKETGNEYTRLRDAASASAAQERASQAAIRTEQTQVKAGYEQQRQELRLLAEQARTTAAQERAAQAQLRTQQAQSGSGGGSSFLGGLAGGAAGFIGTQVLGSAVGVMKDLSGQSLELAGNLEMTRNGFTSLLGSAQAADAELAQLRAFSDKAPLFDTENTQHFAQMLSGAGEQARNLVPDLKAMGAVVAGTGGGTEQLRETALAYSQVLTQGKLAGQEALQFANANVPIWRIVAEGLGVSTAKAKELSTEGKITSEVFQQAFSSYAITHFNDALANAGDTLQGLGAQIQSGWQNALTTFGTGLEQGVKPTLRDIAATLQDPATLESIKAWGIEAGQFVGQLWQGAKVVAGWIGIKLPEVPQAPDYSSLKVDSGAVSTNLQTSVTAAVDYSREIAKAKDQVGRLRDSQAAAAAQDTNRINDLRDAQVTVDRDYQRQLDTLHDQGTALERNFSIQKQQKDLADAQSQLSDDRRLAGDIFSSVGQAARDRYKADLQRVKDVQGQITQDSAKFANQQAVTGVERTKTGYDQGQADRITAIERERTAREQANAAAIRDLEAQQTALDKLQKALASPDPGIKAASDEYRAAYDSAFTSIQADSAQATTDTISAATAEYQSFYQTDLPKIAGDAQPGILGALFGSADVQQQAGTDLANNLIGGLGTAIHDWTGGKGSPLMNAIMGGDNLADAFNNWVGGAAGIENLGGDFAKSLFPEWKGLGAAAADATGNPDVVAAQAVGQAAVTSAINGDTGPANDVINDINRKITDWVNNLTGGTSAPPAAPAGNDLDTNPRHRAFGGPVDSGWYTVGERGPELLHAGGSGFVIPHGGKLQQFGPRNADYYAAEGGLPPGQGGQITTRAGGDTYIFNISGMIGNEAQLAAKIGEILSLNAPGWQGWGAA